MTKEEDCIRGHKIVNITKGPEAAFDVDTCPEREVILRVWDSENLWTLLSFDLSPESALKLAEKLTNYARHVVTREIMNT